MLYCGSMAKIYPKYEYLRYSVPLLQYALSNATEFKICDRAKTIVVNSGQKGVYVIIHKGNEYGPILYSFKVKYSKTVTPETVKDFIHVLVKSELTEGRVHLIIKRYNGLVEFLLRVGEK